MGFFHVYSVTACRIDCETRYIVENCNCRMVHMPGRPHPPLAAANGRRRLRHGYADPSLPGDASFCTPEQYKDCAEPALGRSARAPQRTLTPALRSALASLCSRKKGLPGRSIAPFRLRPNPACHQNPLKIIASSWKP